MSKVFDVCHYLVNRGISEQKPLTNISLQKILYFAQGFYLAETGGQRLFSDKIYAWEYGPVIKSVYHQYKRFGNNQITSAQTFPWRKSSLNTFQISFLEDIWDSFKDYAPFALVEMTHKVNSPWYKIVYDQYNGDVPRDVEIPIDMMTEYFTGILALDTPNNVAEA